MIKPDKNFRLSKAAKTKVALMCKSAEDRNHLRGLLIQGELAIESARRQSLKTKTGKTKDAE